MIETRPISEISHRATRILFENIGVVDTIRFPNQFSIGQGDYTKDREGWLGDISLDAISQMKAERNKPNETISGQWEANGGASRLSPWP